MAVPTFQPQKKSNFSTFLIYIVAVLGVGLVVFFGAKAIKDMGGLKGKSGLSVEVLNGEAEVLLDDEYLGKTPYSSEEVNSGEHKVTVKSDSVTYETNVTFSPNSEVALNRDLGISNAFSSGQNFWLEESDSSTVLSVISEPSGAKIFVDNTQMGTAPYSTDTLSEGEYDLRIEAAGFETQTARIKIQKDYKLNIVAKLFPVPVPSKVSLLEDSADLYDVYSGEAVVTSSPGDWAKAVAYWNKTRGINLSGTGVNKEPVFDYFVDYAGGIYDADGNNVTENANEVLEEIYRGGYLRKVSDGTGVTEAAKTALENLSVSTGKVATINQTPTGWLNMRASPSLDGDVVTQVDVGGQFPVLEEVTGWVKIRVPEVGEGWVYSQYVTINE